MADKTPTIVIIGLGYVGLPLAIALARRHRVIGYDRDQSRIEDLKAGLDRTREVGAQDLAATSMSLTAAEGNCVGADLYIVTVPTPVDASNEPDLGPLRAASEAIGRWIDPARRPTVVFESTVYPGCTEEVCGPAIEQSGGLVRGRDFRLGYSPERINPGDQVHRLDKIVKVVAGEDPEVLDQLSDLYGSITEAGVFRAASIRTAEAAKVIENAQRDINIAFINEVTQIFAGMDVSIADVLAAARTKWNFLPFEPGMVGGHCIGVDPYYLAHAARAQGYDPRVILAGRETNDGMGRWIADRLHAHRGSRPGSVRVLGLTFKENVPDLRNSKVVDVIRRLTELGHQVEVSDPLADAGEAEREYGVILSDASGKPADLVIAAVAHDAYRNLDASSISAMIAPGGTLADVKGIWREKALDGAFDRWGL